MKTMMAHLKFAFINCAHKAQRFYCNFIYS